ncbi:MAG: glycosyltransferase family 4 protein [Candidatus Sumerlaeia bacterium]
MSSDVKGRVLLVNRALPAHWAGGLERHVEDLAIGLAAAGWGVDLLAAPLGADEFDRYRDFGINVHPASCAAPRRYSLGYMLGIGHIIEKLLTKERFDVIHAQEFGLGLWRAPRPAPPIVLSVHGTITSETPMHPDVYRTLGPGGRARAWARYGRRFLFAPAWRRALGRADAILIDSAFSRGELERIAPECLAKTRLVPLAVREAGDYPDRAASRERLGWRGVQLLTIGRLEWAKGHELALEALAGLREFKWHYTIAGEGSWRPAIERAIGRLGLGGRVRLAGRVSQADKLAMLAGADLFVWPERTHPAFGLAGLEALLADTPVVATRRGAIPEVIGERGWLAEPTAESLAGALKPLLADPARLAAARAGLREDALARFAFERMVAGVESVYKSLLP